MKLLKKNYALLNMVCISKNMDRAFQESNDNTTNLFYICLVAVSLEVPRQAKNFTP